MQGKRNNQINDSENTIIIGIMGIVFTLLCYLLISVIEKIN